MEHRAPRLDDRSCGLDNSIWREQFVEPLRKSAPARRTTMTACRRASTLRARGRRYRPSREKQCRAEPADCDHREDDHGGGVGPFVEAGDQDRPATAQTGKSPLPTRSLLTLRFEAYLVQGENERKRSSARTPRRRWSSLSPGKHDRSCTHQLPALAQAGFFSRSAARGSSDRERSTRSGDPSRFAIAPGGVSSGASSAWRMVSTNPSGWSFCR